MKTMVSVYVAAVALLLASCGDEAPDVEQSAAAITTGLRSYAGSMTCPSEAGSIAVVQLATFARTNIWGVGTRWTVKFDPYPSGRAGRGEMTLDCPTLGVLDETPYHANTNYLNCRVIAHPASDPNAWAITGQIQIAPGALEFVPPDSIHPQGYVSIWQALPTPHWDIAHGLCAFGNDSILMQ